MPLVEARAAITPRLIVYIAQVNYQLASVSYNDDISPHLRMTTQSQDCQKKKPSPPPPRPPFFCPIQQKKNIKQNTQQ